MSGTFPGTKIVERGREKQKGDGRRKTVDEQGTKQLNVTYFRQVLVRSLPHANTIVE